MKLFAGDLNFSLTQNCDKPFRLFQLSSDAVISVVKEQDEEERETPAFSLPRELETILNFCSLVELFTHYLERNGTRLAFLKDGIRGGGGGGFSGLRSG